MMNDETLTITREQIIQAFADWESSYRTNPEQFLTQEEIAARAVGDTATACGIYFIGLLRMKHPPVTDAVSEESKPLYAAPNCPDCRGRGRYRIPYSRDEFIDCECLSSEPISATSNATAEAESETDGSSASKIEIAVRVRSYTEIEASVSATEARPPLRSNSSRLSNASEPSRTSPLRIAISFDIGPDFDGRSDRQKGGAA